MPTNRGITKARLSFPSAIGLVLTFVRSKRKMKEAINYLDWSMKILLSSMMKSSDWQAKKRQKSPRENLSLRMRKISKNSGLSNSSWDFCRIRINSKWTMLAIMKLTSKVTDLLTKPTDEESKQWWKTVSLILANSKTAKNMELACWSARPSTPLIVNLSTTSSQASDYVVSI